MDKLIQINGVCVNFYTYDGIVRALDNLTLDIYQGETLGLVGETGCGKTMTALAILRLIMPPGKIESGTIHFNPDGSGTVDLLSLNEKDIRAIRGSKISMVFQEPGNALNPVYTIGDQISEVILLHRNNEMINAAVTDIDLHLNQKGSGLEKINNFFRRIQKHLLLNLRNNPGARLPRFIQRFPLIKRLFWRIADQARKASIIMLKEVDIPDAERIVNYFPHQLSGGMKQRAVIAMALACYPKFLIADEPTTALDVTIQAQILDLLQRLKDEFNSSVLYITHDLGVAAAICNRVGVMYGGSIIELAEVNEIFARPLHPYTRSLLAAVPKPGEEPTPIAGYIPDPLNLPPGCPFNPRCPLAQDICRVEKPAMLEISTGHMVSCHMVSGESSASAN